MKTRSTYYFGIYKAIFRTISCIFFITLTIKSSAQTSVKLDFSHERGFSDVAFNLVITSTEAGATIRYTLDGEEPTTTSGAIYNGSLSIDTTTVLRAIGYIIGTDTSKVYTHTYLFLDEVILQPENINGWPNNTYDIGNGSATAVHDYEMDPSIVNSPAYNTDLIQGLKDIPTMSIVMPKDDFWDMYDGSSEKKTSIELLYFDDPSKNEQEDGGIEPHSHDRLKRSMRLSFKNIYGTANWDSDIFRNAVVGAETAENEFDRIVLRAGNNRAWSRNWNTDRTAFTRDEWFRQSQIASSGIGAHGTFVHLYVNGIYWGLYNPVERPDEAFTSTYLGGEKEDWFAVSHGGNQGGSSTRYDYMRNTILNTDLTQSSNYEELKAYLDINQFSDYLLVSWMTGVQDWPNNNWWAGNRNTPEGPLMYFGWDNEWSWDVTRNANNGAWVHPEFESNDTGGSASAFVFNKSKVNVDFMMAFADRAYKLCYNNGAMTDDNSRLRWSTLNDNIANAVVAESARWGDGINDGTTRTRDVHWQNEVDRLDGLMDGNVNRLIVALRGENYYPTNDPPLFENNNVAIEVQELSVAAGYAIDLVNPNSNGDIYYTTNGVDPRLSGGAIDPSAINYSNQALIINSSTNLLARVKQGNEWSALHCLNIIVNEDLSWIKLTEIMYNPVDSGTIDGGELEFLEIKNTSTSLTLDISGLQISDGVDFTFPVGTSMAPQSFLVLASNASALAAKCPGLTVFGEYGGALSNGGEMIEFVTFVGDTIIRVEYDDKSPWPTEADGGGYSLVPTEVNPTGSQNDASLWKLSADNFCGSPLTDDVYFCEDSDNDSVCDVDDLCPGFDDTLIYTSCDDGDANTVNDVYTTACICEGIPVENSDLSWIKLTEIMYNPADFGIVDGGELEFLEIKNTSTTLTLNIGGLKITDGVDFTFPFGTTIDPQSFLIVASNPAELSAKCANISVFGQYEGGLSNSGEMIEFVSAGANDTIIRVEYDDASPWPTDADGNGYSLVPTDPNPIGAQDDPSLWTSSADDFCGSPLADEVDCPDTDEDGVCDDVDQCPSFDDDLIGTSCDDGNPCTINDVYTSTCECIGTIQQGTNDLITLSAIDDAYLQGSTRFNADILRIEANNRVAYLKFNIPVQSGTLINADIKLQVSNDPGNGEILAFLGSTNNWTESNLSTSNKPAEVTQIGSLDTTYTIGQTYTWPLDTAQIASGDISIILRHTGGNDVSFHSDEASTTMVRPILSLSYSNSYTGLACDDGDSCTVNDIVDENCNCAGTFADADNDGICDAEDDCDSNLIGSPCDDNDPNTFNDVYDANCDCQGTEITNPLLEAENAIVGSNWSIQSDTLACGDQYALPPNTTQFNQAPSLAEDHITFTFSLDVAGTYKVYARTMTTNGNDDSFWVRANGGTWNPWNKINFGNYGNFYQWSQAGNWTSGDYATPITFQLTAGINTVDFAWREPGARLDKIFVTNEDLSVLNLVRNNDSSGDLSFKYTIEEACPNDTIRFEPSTNGTMIVVDSSMITIDRTLTIIGNGPTQTLLSGDTLYQIFTNTSYHLSIHDLKMRDGFAPSNGGAFINNGVLYLQDIELEGNKEGSAPKAFSNNGIIRIKENTNVIIKE